MNITTVTSVPCSYSNRSNNGVKASRFASVCISPICKNGYVFSLYTIHLFVSTNSIPSTILSYTKERTITYSLHRKHPVVQVVPNSEIHDLVPRSRTLLSRAVLFVYKVVGGRCSFVFVEDQVVGRRMWLASSRWSL